MIQGEAPVKLVQGQAYNYVLSFDNNQLNLIDKIFIVCEKLNFCHELEQNSIDSTLFEYLFTSDETKQFNNIITNYSIIIHSVDEKLDPQILPNQRFAVVENKNQQSCGV